MKNFTHLFLFSVLLIVTAPQFSHAQTLVNLARQYTTNQASLTYPFQTAIKISDSEMVVVGSVNSTTNSNFVFATKYNTVSGAVEWEDSGSIAYNSSTNYIEAITGACVAGPYLYVSIAVNVQQFGNGLSLAASGIAVGKFSLDNGAEVWLNHYYLTYVIDSSVQLTDTSYIMPTSIVADGAQNVYVGGIQETGYTGSQLLVFKIDSNGNQLWSDTQSISVYSGAAAIEINPGDTTLTVTGFSGTAWNSWDFVTATVATDSGNITKASFSNYGPAFQSPAGLVEDYGGRPYIAGTIGAGGSGTAIEMIGYDTSLNQRFAKIWSNADSMHLDSAARMQQDANANILITGFTTAINGAKNLLTLKYSTAGTLLWSRTIAAPNPIYNCVGNSITADDSLNVYVTGYFYNGSNNDFITIAFDPNGNTLWEKTYDGGGTNDVANDIVADDNNNVWVSGVSSIDTIATYLTLEYQTKTYTITTVNDTSGNPLYVQGNVIVRFAPNVLDTDFVNNSGLVYGALNQVLKSSYYSTLVSDFGKDYPDVNLTDAYLVKLAPNYRTWNNYLISNLGDTVIIPPFWSSFLMAFTSSTTTEQQVANELKSTYPNVKYAHLNLVGYYASCDSGGACDSVTPTDDFYCTEQFAINGNDTATYGNGQMNTEAAWAIETGKPFVKVGILDGDVWYQHPDFLTDSANMISKVIAGVDYGNGFPNLQSIPLATFTGHGTSVAGIIGAIRNNGKGIAGVAGGNWCGNTATESPGASLYSFGVANGTVAPGGEPNILMSFVIQAMNDAINTDTTISYSNMDILNCSFVFYPIFEPDSEFPELKEKYYMASRMGKIVVAARGEANGGGHTESGNPVTYPACYNTDWLITVGGSDEHGDGYGGYINYLDVVAPYPSDMNYTTNTYFYGAVEGTSASAPYVTGLVALIKSYLDDPGGPDSINVAPEDAEQIIQRTAWFDSQAYPDTPYDPAIGWGRVDMGKAMQMIDKSHNRLLHFNSATSPTTYNISEVASGINLTLLEDVPNPAIPVPQQLPAGNYEADVFKVTEYVNYKPALLHGENIISDWARPSASNSYPLFSVDSVNELEPYEEDSILPVSGAGNDSTATLWGYFYLMEDTLGDTLGWIPQNPFPYDGFPSRVIPKMSFSVYISSDTIIPTAIIPVKSDFSLSVFPNPTESYFHLLLTSDVPDLYTIQLYNAIGQPIKTLFTGLTDYISNDYYVVVYSAGMYYIGVSSARNNSMVKLVITK